MWMLFIGSQAFSRQSVCSLLLLNMYPWSLEVFVPKFGLWPLYIFVCNLPWFSAWPRLLLLLSYAFTCVIPSQTLFLTQIKLKLVNPIYLVDQYFIEKIFFSFPYFCHNYHRLSIYLDTSAFKWPILFDTSQEMHQEKMQILSTLFLSETSNLSLELILSTSLQYVLSSHPAS